MAEKLRFLHTSNWRLEQPPGGLPEVSPALRDRLLEAPLEAARRVVDLAVSEAVDFVLLAGDIAHPPQAGPRGLSFLMAQLGRLCEKGIPVYWPCGEHELAWPGDVPLPEGVHRFGSDRESVVHRRDGQPLARIWGQSPAAGDRVALSDFDDDAEELFCVGATVGTFHARDASPHRPAYLALGGRANRRVLTGLPRPIQYSGSPQGRSFQQTGPHGCTLVSVGDDHVPRDSTVATDVVRYVCQSIQPPRSADRAELQSRLAEAVAALRDTADGRDLLVAWQIAAGEPLATQLRSGGRDKLLAWLRDEFGSASPALWSASIRISAPRLPEHLYREDTFLGDYLRHVQAARDEPAAQIDLSDYLPADFDEAARLTEAVVQERQRQFLLDEAARLGGQLLGSATYSDVEAKESRR